MVYRIAEDGKFKQGLQNPENSLPRIQIQLLEFIQSYGKVHRKVIALNAGSYADTTLRKHLDLLKEKGLISENSDSAYSLTGEGVERVKDL